MLSFFVITMHFSNIMTTDMIVVLKPDVIETLEEVFEKEHVIPTFPKQITDYKLFENAIEETREYQFWKQLKTRYNENDSIIEVLFNPSSIPFLIDICHRRRIFILNNVLEKTFRTTICHIKHDLPKLHSYAPVDPRSQEFSVGLVIRKSSDNAIITRVTKKMLHFFDMGITDYNMRESAKGKVSKDLFPEDPPDMHECMSDTVVMLKPGFQAASDSNFKSIAHFCLILVLISAVCLVCEIFTRKLLFAK